MIISLWRFLTRLVSGKKALAEFDATVRRDDLRRAQIELIGNGAPRKPPIVFGFGGKKWIGIVGESYYQRGIARCFGPGIEPRDAVDVVAELIPDDDNRHDKNAVKVMINGRQVGHLSRYYARKWRSTPGKPRQLTGRAIRGDWVDSTGRKALHNVEVAI